MTKTFEELEAKVDIQSRAIAIEAELRGSNVEKILERIKGLESVVSGLEQHTNGFSNATLSSSMRILEKDILSRINSCSEVCRLHHIAITEIRERTEGLEVCVHEMDRGAPPHPTDANLATRVRALELLLEGDKHLRAEWEKQHKLGVTPNIPEPPEGGALFAIDRTFEAMRSSIEALARKLEAKLWPTPELSATILKLEQFFGPMLRDKTPPIDGQQIADKAYVDEAVARIARAVRSEYSDAASFTVMLLKTFARAAGEVGDTASVQIMRATSRIVYAWEQEMARERSRVEKTERPSRLQMLLWVITGRPAPEYVS